ncbi:hypothetical protein [Microbacter margulisiae]|uniref:Outer membrane protein beta-barrel domain-containing protein n=1 Tax=Microbacter margulisiae TaxID=1350067 RepID=A0A7W5DU63_9PORP|nr:hypothetical protein [Microbacter margulisiae]MBB3188775.1 hypothetical protein [Microbacter margulisiae]
MRTHVLVLLAFVATGCFAQAPFKKGYFINNSNQKTECLIKNDDWKNNPKSFEYKINERGEVKQGNLATVKEFGIDGYSKYVRTSVNIDRSPMLTSDLSNTRNPVWEKDTLFLKVILEGKASLYYYDNGYIVRFFYSVASTPIQQLIYKEYLTGETGIATNSDYQNQLWLYVRAKGATMNSMRYISYGVSDLEHYFNKYNTEYSGAYASAQFETTQDIQVPVNIRITPGIDVTSLAIENNFVGSPRYADYGHASVFRIGLEGEFLLPFNHHNWGVVIEPAYQLLNAHPKGSSSTVHLSFVEFPVGLRRYFVFKNWKLFLDGFYTNDYGLTFNSNFQVDPFYFETPYKIKRVGGSFAIGGGFGYSLLSVELRYYTSTNFLDNYINWDSNYNRVALIVGIRIFGTRTKYQK